MELPAIKLDHLNALTDDTGILQHAKYSTPKRREGYTTDDNARALIACIKYQTLCAETGTESLIHRYLSFLLHMQREDGRFHNLLSYGRRFLDDVGSEDCMGRALFACGYVLASPLPEERKRVAKELFDNGFKWVNNFTSPRAKALTIMGLQHYNKAFPEDNSLLRNTRRLTDQLCESFQQATSEWQWFEPYLTYENPRLSQALFQAYASTKKDTYRNVGEASFTFLIKNQIIDDMFYPFGNQGWYRKNQGKALYDQQPVEASSMVETAMTAFHVLGDKKYLKVARVAFDWFLGHNSQNIWVYDPRTGGCYDGVNPEGVNLNQGAESTICYLLARLEVERINQINQ